ncbi:MAG: hypothetical protein IJV21_01825 [Lachnospiraceae bacterium]|nr:hypothetical protein [Lachnospiraceae bacterium]MBR1671130.1 hypothetical protein [Butyrivibrio sp.]
MYNEAYAFDGSYVKKTNVVDAVKVGDKYVDRSRVKERVIEFASVSVILGALATIVFSIFV